MTKLIPALVLAFAATAAAQPQYEATCAGVSCTALQAPAKPCQPPPEGSPEERG